MTEKRMTDEKPPSSKNMRYDRQLRLWGDEGQNALENASVCLLNATTFGCEILKNLVLPGIGEVCMVDDKVVCVEDIQTNFFLSYKDIGKSRVECASERIQQLNPDVKQTVYNLSIPEFINTHLSILKRFSVFIISNVPQDQYQDLAQVAWDANIPLLIANIVGMYTEIRLIVKEHTIIESKPDTPLPDLRLEKPFTELIDFYQNIDFAGFTDTEHAHIPFVIILLKCLDTWRAEHGGEIPKNYREKQEFKKLISGLRRKNDEENFNEACAMVNKCVVKTVLPSYIDREVFNDPNISLTSSSTPFWITAAAVKQFYNIKGVLPVTGVLEDMTADSQSFIALQNLYRKKAMSDANGISEYVAELLKKHHIPEGYVNQDYIHKFSKNANFVRVIRTGPVDRRSEEVKEELEACSEDVDNLGHIIILFEAYQSFLLSEGRCPGDRDENVTDDVIRLSQLHTKLQAHYGLPELVPTKYIEDFVRYGGCELPSVAASSGGCAAHECIKLITKQYIPVNNCFVYSGGSQTTAVFTV